MSKRVQGFRAAWPSGGHDRNAWKGGFRDVSKAPAVDAAENIDKSQARGPAACFLGGWNWAGMVQYGVFRKLGGPQYRTPKRIPL